MTEFETKISYMFKTLIDEMEATRKQLESIESRLHRQLESDDFDAIDYLQVIASDTGNIDATIEETKEG